MGLIKLVKQGNLPEIEVALSRNTVKTDEPDFLLNTPLHHAAKSNRTDIAELLMAHGANPAKTNIFGRSAKDLASSDQMSAILSREKVLIPAVTVWPARGVWWWAGFMAVGLIVQISQTGDIGRAPDDVVLEAIGLFLVSYLAITAICAWWFSESKRRCRRGFLLRVIGYLLFASGSLCPVSAAAMAASPILASHSTAADRTSIIPLALSVGLAGVTLIVVAYFCVFRRVTSPPNPVVEANTTGR
jgi:hypothetical protein